MYASKVFLAVSLLLFFSACGGGGGNSGTVLSGQFVDSAVAGVRYSTQTRSGVTNSEGMFEYLEGESVSFYLGDLRLGDAQGANMVSLFDLVDGATPVVGGELKIAIWAPVQGPGFSSVINLAILLQTLDGDGNPDNGIEISADVASLFDADSVDFEQHWQQFSSDLGFRRAMAEAKERALLDSDRQIRKPWRALAHLYASLAIDAGLRVESTSSGDNDGDGSPEYAIRYEYDTEGKPAREVYQSTQSDTVSIEEYSYDTQANLVRYEQDYDNDGLPDEIISYTYDDDGNQTVLATDSNGDGVWDDIYTYSFDAYRNRIREGRDIDGDGSPDSITSEIYDATGKVERYEYDTDGDGIPEEIRAHSYNADGNVVRTVVTAEIDGPPQKVYNYVYSADGLNIRMEIDSDGDGTTDAVERNIFAADGSQRRLEYDDTYGDGMLDGIVIFSYDENGKEVRYEHDRGADGSLDSIITRTYDANGHETQFTYDSNASGTPEQTHTITRDGAGYEILREIDLTSDGAADRIYSTSYEPSAVGWWWVFNRGAPRRSMQLLFPSGFPGNPSDPGSDGGYVIVISSL
ncbi:Uncharacterised protein [Halioglobus japonicus]|nr:Uncharacterised protein [Halioglobus japonicus]